jgi:cell division protein FtsL
VIAQPAPRSRSTAPRRPPAAAHRGRPQRPQLRVVEDRPLSRRARRRRTRVVVTVAAVLATACLLGVAIFHAVLISGQIRLDELEARVAEEQASYQRSRLEVARLESPQRVVAVAQERLGMVPPGEITYLSPSLDAAGEVAAAAPVDGAPDERGRSHPQAWATIKPYLGDGR